MLHIYICIHKHRYTDIPYMDIIHIYIYVHTSIDTHIFHTLISFIYIYIYNYSIFKVLLECFSNISQLFLYLLNKTEVIQNMVTQKNKN